MECLGRFVGKQNPCMGQATVASCNLIVLLIETIIQNQCNISSIQKYPPCYSDKLKPEDTFDYIVVGAGTSGSIVASRLAEFPEWKVLLLEAGTYPSISSDIPWLHASLVESPEDWNFTTDKQPDVSTGLKGGVAKLPRGKVVGGTSAINPMIYMRGNKKDYDAWSGMGNQEWCYDCIKKQFEKVEQVREPLDPTTYYGRKGRVHLTQKAPTDNILKAIKSALYSRDVVYSNDEIPTGYFPSFSYSHLGVRESSSRAYIADGRERPNLFLATDAEVTKVIIEPEEKKLKGVEVRVNKKILKIMTNKEVILAAGPYKSPQILTHSGIGLKSEVSTAGATLIKELHVGENLQDQVAYPGFIAKLSDCGHTLTREDTSQDIFNYILNRQGIMTTGGMNFVGLINTKNITSTQPNVMFYHKVFPKNDQFVTTFMKRFALDTPLIETVEQNNKNYSLLMIIPVLILPRSTGTVTLSNKDPFSKPKIQSGFYKEPEDVTAMADAVLFLEKLLSDSQIAKYINGYVELPLKTCASFKKNKNDWTKCALKDLAASMSNPVGTCKMGPEFDKQAVVDPQLQVYGIKGLRVVDASVMPRSISGDTTGATMMLAEKASKTIREAHMGCVTHNEL